MADAVPSRDDLATLYFEQLPYPPYAVQEEALLAWFSSPQGVLVCAPTGTGKTLIAEAALFEALHNGTIAYYTTPLIALTEQKFREMQAAAVRWGFDATDVGLVTGNRRENPDARILVVVAEILLNRLLHNEAFDFQRTSAVVMDEFHSFADRERGIVWELTLGLLPPGVKLLLLSATVGNAMDFVHWLRQAHQRRVELVQGTERKVPLTFQWIGDQLLPDFLESMAQGDEASRFTPALVFCFNREECWNVAEQIKGKSVLHPGQQQALVRELERHDWSQGAGPKLKQLLMRGVGVHHAGVMPHYRRIVEELFQKKLLSLAMCTETLSAGINLPARSVVVPKLLKGPPEKQFLLDSSTAHQIFGRAGRPQFDTRGFVFALAHEDDVKMLRWKEKYDQIPEDTKDPGLLKAKKALKKKMPKRSPTEQYWTEAQFDKLRAAPPGRLMSRGPLPWRWLAYMLEIASEIEPIRRLVGKRLVDNSKLDSEQRNLNRMLLTLHRGGFVRLEPEPPEEGSSGGASPGAAQSGASPAVSPPSPAPTVRGLLAGLQLGGKPATRPGEPASADSGPPPVPEYQPLLAHPTEKLARLLLFRSVNPMYGCFLIDQLGIADRAERLQAFESVLELPRSLGRAIWVPSQDELPRGPLAETRLDELLITLGLATQDELVARPPEEAEERRPLHSYDERPTFVLPLADKLRRLFDYECAGVRDVRTGAVWAAGEVLQFGDFNKYITSKQLQKQEGILFRHLLRMILLVAEFQQLTPPELTPEDWRAELDDIERALTECCRKIDPTSTEKVLEEVRQTLEKTEEPIVADAGADLDDFATGIFD